MYTIFIYCGKCPAKTCYEYHNGEKGKRLVECDLHCRAEAATKGVL